MVSLVRLRRCESVRSCGRSLAGDDESPLSLLLSVSPLYFLDSPSAGFGRFLRCERGEGVPG